MQLNTLKNVQLVILLDLNRQSFKRMTSIRAYLEQGNILSNSELEFLSEMIVKINICQRGIEHDPECITIFSNIAHLLSRVVSLALKNEQKDNSA